MKIIRTISELQRDRSKRLALVPTMGAFHEGHLSLMKGAKAGSDLTAVSIFVNPTQFAAGEDFEKYPRNFERDCGLAEAVGVDVIFAPTVEEMYPSKSTVIAVSGLSDLWEGSHRPGHFTGVATVVAKLFNILQPDVAYFGLKDLQQCLVIGRMVSDLNVPIELKFEPTVREADGLAMSSRNAYLSPESRKVAPALFRGICEVANSVALGEDAIENQILNTRAELAAVGFQVDYLELVDIRTLRPTRNNEIPAAVIVAARLGATRLIDNVRINC